MHERQSDDAAHPGRRDILLTAGAAVAGGVGAAGPAFAATATPGGINGLSPADRNGGPLGSRLQGVQHFGLTVQNMERAYEFYT